MQIGALDGERRLISETTRPAGTSLVIALEDERVKGAHLMSVLTFLVCMSYNLCTESLICLLLALVSTMKTCKDCDIGQELESMEPAL